MASASTEPIQILRTGLWHGNEVSAESGSEWWGIFPDGKGWTLKKALIEVVMARDSMVDGPDEKSGKRVTVSEDREPVLLVRGMENSLPGRLDGIREPLEVHALWPGPPLSLALESGSRPFQLSLFATGTIEEEHSYVRVEDYRLRIRRGSGKTLRWQTLHDTFEISGRPRLHWAGDLDRDGVSDLLVDVADHYNEVHLVLFLSSIAKEGELLGKAAEWVTAGC